MDQEVKYPIFAVRHASPSHYYGDYVRWIFLFASAILFLSLPFFPELVSANIYLEIAGAVLLVIFAALTNPLKRSIMLVNVILSIIGVVVFELLAVDGYQAKEWILFIEREVLAILFLFALYYSLKTVRAMYMEQITIK